MRKKKADSYGDPYSCWTDHSSPNAPEYGRTAPDALDPEKPQGMGEAPAPVKSDPIKVKWFHGKRKRRKK